MTQALDDLGCPLIAAFDIRKNSSGSAGFLRSSAISLAIPIVWHNADGLAERQAVVAVSSRP
jgi:hypothetical protein